MGVTISTVILALTLIPIVIDGLLGLMRGRNRAILRFILVVVCAIITLFAVKPIIAAAMSMEIEGVPFKEFVSATILEGASEFPQELIDLIFMIVEMILGVILYFVVFLVLKFITWLILFPILKIFVKKGEKKGVGLGFLFGILQGVVVAFLICAPITGLVGQVGKLTNVDMSFIATQEGGSQMVQTDDLGINEYLESPLYKIYSSTGNWLFESVSSTTDANGNKVSLSNTIDVLITIVNVAGEAQDITPNIEKLLADDITASDLTGALKDLGDNLVVIGDSINGLDDGGKTIINSFINAVGGLLGEEVPQEVVDMIESFDINNLKLSSVGASLKGIASYIEKTTEGFEAFGQSVSQDEVTAIVNGFADNTFMLDMLTGGGNPENAFTIAEVTAEHAQMFETAIANNSTLTEDQKTILRVMFGL